MKIVTYNIQYSLGKDERYDLARVVEAVAEADIIALQEVERFYPRTGMSDQPAEIAARLPDHYFVYGPETDLHVGEDGGDRRAAGRRRQFGNMLLSRWPILSSRNHLLPHVGTTSHCNAQAAALEGVIETGGRALRVYSLHLTHLSQRDRLPQVDWLLDLNRRAWLEGGVWTEGPESLDGDWQIDPVPPMPFDGLYLGDFNFDPADPEYDRMVGPVDPDHGRVHYRDLLIDAWVAAGNGERDGITYPLNDRYPAQERGWRLDYCFVTPTLDSLVRRAWIDEAAEGSDHQPAWFEIDV
jgi:endonuclease/exonuclease/phosphatase family metal-dependent hydrolase